jgi:hypothetical protein
VRGPEPKRTIAQRPLIVALFLCALVGVQLIAMARQFRAGFLPLMAAPTRVPFSWDMFAIPIERCDMRWEPALPIGVGPTTLRSLAPALEWDPIYNEVADYLRVAHLTCHLHDAPSRVVLRCVTGRGFEQHVVDCP